MKDDGLQLSVEESIPPVIYASGELDYGNCERLEILIGELIDKHGTHLAVHAGGLSFVDSSGVRVILKTAVDLAQAGGRLQVISPTAQFRHVLMVTGLNGYIDIGEAPKADPIADRDTHTATGSFECQYPVCPESCRSARNGICRFASEMGFPLARIDDIRLAVGEAAANAARHGLPGMMKVECHCEDGLLTIRLSYPSEPFEPDNVPVPDFDLMAEGGMGIHFMRSVMDMVSYEFSGGETTLTMVKKRGHDGSV